jgi:uncharacterized protein YecE (DUF72 family)
VIAVGTCGYAYKDWLGPFYPASARSSEMLTLYAQSFSAVEIDASFYGVLKPGTVAAMVARTPPHFLFCFKVPQTVTHEKAPAGALHPDAQAFVRSITPAIESGKFGCALAQFPHGFRNNAESMRYLSKVLHALASLDVVVEFRNAEWQTGAVHRFLTECGAGWCNVDMPGFSRLLHASADVTSQVGYVRFHGRNAATWWKGDNRSRYDYDYTVQEMRPWIDRVGEIAGSAKRTFVFFNNHARANAPRNAALFATLLLEHYGETGGYVPRDAGAPVQGSLFE